MSDKIIHQSMWVIRDGKNTIAFGVYVNGEKIIPFAGSTSKHPNDKENKERGQKLAIGNAFRNLGRQILKSEWKNIKQQYSQRPKNTRTTVKKTSESPDKAVM